MDSFLSSKITYCQSLPHRHRFCWPARSRRNNATTGWKDKQKEGGGGVGFRFSSTRMSEGTIMCIRRAEEDEIPRLTTYCIDEMDGRADALRNSKTNGSGRVGVGMNERTTARARLPYLRSYAISASSSSSSKDRIVKQVVLRGANRREN